MNEHELPEQSHAVHEHTRTGLSKEALNRAILDNLFYLQGRDLEAATLNDLYMAVAYTVRHRMLDRWVKSSRTYKRSGARTVCYLSAECLLGPHLVNNLVNLGILETARAATAELGVDFDALVEQEEEPGLGNGG
jgi:glycogen phosphorylase